MLTTLVDIFILWKCAKSAVGIEVSKNGPIIPSLIFADDSFFTWTVIWLNQTDTESTE